MLFSRTTPAALLATAALFSSFVTQAVAKDTEILFDKCITECVAGAQCAWNEPECMCTNAQDNLLILVASCMYYHCKDEMSQYDEKFLDILVAGCKELGDAIPKTNIAAAEKSAQTYISKLATASATTTATKPTSTTTAKAALATTSESQADTPTTVVTKTKTSESSTSESSQPTEIVPVSTTAAAAADTTAQQTTLALATGSPTAAGLASASTTTSASSSEPTDSSPFAAVADSGAMRGMTSWVWAGVPLAVAVLMR